MVESKPDSFVVDLRIHEPFPELRKYADSIDLSTATQMAHKHIPYVVLLIKALDAWRNTVSNDWHAND
jgi:amyloid beta precursor protein binding protein 1